MVERTTKEKNSSFSRTRKCNDIYQRCPKAQEPVKPAPPVDLEYEAQVRTLILFVPGTTDPVNISYKAKGDASQDYWDSPLIDAVQGLTARYDIFQIRSDFRWSGDNDITSRQQAGQALLDYVIKHRSWFLGAPVEVHLICHSHGGNVINEFTHLAAARADFPKNFSIKGIVYLSTPFFKNQAQLNDKIFHPQCKIINVYNQYDLTQRFVANFSMHQMPLLIESFETDEAFNGALKKLKETPFVAMAAGVAGMGYTNRVLFGLMSGTFGRGLWEKVRGVFTNIETLLNGISGIMDDIYKAHPEFITPDILANINKGIIESLTKDLAGPIDNLNRRLADKKAQYSMGRLFEDIGPGVGDLIKHFNDFITFPRGSLISPLMELIDKILLNQIDTFDNTVISPKNQVKGKFPVTEIDVTRHDPYDRCPESHAHYNTFITKLEELEVRYEGMTKDSPQGTDLRAEILFQLIAQMPYVLNEYIDTTDNLLTWLDRLLGGRSKELIRLTQANLGTYRRELAQRDRDLVSRADIRNEKLSFAQKKGGIPYLAVESHSVSRRVLHEEIKSAWVSELYPIGQAPKVKVKVKFPGST